MLADDAAALRMKSGWFCDHVSGLVGNTEPESGQPNFDTNHVMNKTM